MDIEQKISNLIGEIAAYHHTTLVGSWIHTLHFHPSTITWARDLVDSPEEEEYLAEMVGVDTWIEYKAIQLIRSASEVECLTSSSAFIREAKEWLINESRTKN